MLRLAAAGIALLALGSVASAGALTNDMDLVYGKYQMALQAARLCRGVVGDDAIWRRWSTYIDAKTDHELGAGERLSIIEGVKSDVTYMVRRQGCDSDDIKDLLALYDAELGPLVSR